MGESGCERDGNRDDAMSGMRGAGAVRVSGPLGSGWRGWGPRLHHVLGPSAVGVW